MEAKHTDEEKQLLGTVSTYLPTVKGTSGADWVTLAFQTHPRINPPGTLAERGN